MKIMVVGHSGSGKTVLALSLSKHYGIEALHLDAVQYQTGWQNRRNEETTKIMDNFMNSHKDWIIDGNYRRREFFQRAKQANTIYYLNYNRFTCLFRAINRRIAYRNVKRVSLADGCHDRLNPSFIYWILIKGRTREFMSTYESLKLEYGYKTIEFKSPRELKKYLDSLGIEVVKE